MTESVVLSFVEGVDILFVIDNSGSMGEEQANLSSSFASLINVLEDPEVDADYRIGITTTDNGNPWCGSTGPEAGNMRLTSCRSRPSEFTFEGATVIESFDEACDAQCPEGWDDINVQPTTVDGQDEPAVRPWLERIDGMTNLPDGLDVVQALQCFAPQGIDGCGFESHLESMQKAITRARDPNEDEHGFLREDAILAIVHLTDEEDCSYNSDWETIFLADGDRTFWSDPMAASPTSAVCWNAGVFCEGDDCQPVDLGVDGKPVAAADAEDDAVLLPLSRYVDSLQALETGKQLLAPDREVLVALIGGVNSDGTVTYQPSLSDKEFQDTYGIGPGCQSVAGEAVPPVRLRAFAEAFQTDDRVNMHSICAGSYSSAFAAIGEAIAEQLAPPCITTIVADTDPSTPSLEPACEVYYHAPDDESERIDIPACDDVDPADVATCFRLLTDETLSEQCAAAGWNAEVVLERSDRAVLPSAVVVVAECEIG